MAVDAPSEQTTQVTQHSESQGSADRLLVDSADIRRAPQSTFFLYGGILFLLVALALFLLTAYLVYISSKGGLFVHLLDANGAAPPETTRPSPELSEREMTAYFAGMFEIMFGPFTCIFSALICSMIGIRLLRAAGVATTQVISPQDFPILGPAVRDANEAAITQFIRLSSLSGTIGMFTKIGLTGLPLATIFLTVFLAVLGLLNPQFFELAKLTLGAFLGSFVQRQAELTKAPVPQSDTKKI